MQWKMVVPDGKINKGGRVIMGISDLSTKTGLDLTNIHAISWDTETASGTVEYSDGSPNEAATQDQADGIQAAFASVEGGMVSAAKAAAGDAVAAGQFFDLSAGSIGANLTIGP